MGGDKPGSATARHGRIFELDALRGFAALAVVLYHYTYFIGTMFPGTPLPPIQVTLGCYGVQLFFAISGFVILMTLECTERAADFVRARFLRLFPVYWVAVTLTFVVVTLCGPAVLKVGAWDYLRNLSMLQLYIGAPLVDGVYWSLNVELAFYAAMLLLWRTGLTRRIEWVLVGWIALRWLHWAWPTMPPLLAQALIADHIAYFAIGILAYRIWAGHRRWYEQLPFFAVAAGTVIALDPTDAHWLVAGLVPLFLALALRRLTWLGTPWLTRLGAISYPLYLVHGAIGYIAILKLEAWGASPTVATLVALAGALMLASFITYRIEPRLKGIGGARRSGGTTRAAPEQASH